MHRCENRGEILNVGFLPHHMELQVFFFFFPPNENKEPLTALEARWGKARLYSRGSLWVGGYSGKGVTGLLSVSYGVSWVAHHFTFHQ